MTTKRIPELLWGGRFFDVDKDGQKEFVAVSDNDIIVYKYTFPALTEINRIKGEMLDRHIRIDTDPSRLYVTNFRSGRLASIVLSDSLKPVVTDVPWLLRTIEWNGGSRLVGQHVGSTDQFSGRIAFLNEDGRKMRNVEDMSLPGMSQIYGILEFAGVSEEGRYMAELALNGHVYLWKNMSAKKWKKAGRSAGRYGDTANCVKHQLRDVMDEAKSEYLCVPPSPVLYVTKEGPQRVLVPDHKMYLSKVFGQFPFPKEGRIVGLEWDEMLGWREVWQTTYIPGYIADHFIDTDPLDGRRKLFLIVQVKDGGIVGSMDRGESVLLNYDLER